MNNAMVKYTILRYKWIFLYEGDSNIGCRQKAVCVVSKLLGFFFGLKLYVICIDLPPFFSSSREIMSRVREGCWGNLSRPTSEILHQYLCLEVEENRADPR